MNPVTLTRAMYRDFRGIETDPRSDEEHLKAAIDWLYRSQDVTDCGGSAAYYNLLTGWAGPYPETSGYIVPTLYDYGEYADSREARERARQMAQWVLTTQLESGAFPGGVDPGSNAKPSVFNTGQILFGLVRAYEETSHDTYLEATERAGQWLCDVHHDCGYWDRFDYRDEIHTYCSRVAWALLEAERVTGNDAFRDGAITNLEWVVSTQTDTNWFENAGFSPGEVPYLHTIAYTIRGLLEGGLVLEEDEYIASAKAAADTLLEERSQNGPLAGRYDQNWDGGSFYCLTGNAQMATIWGRLHHISGDDRYRRSMISEREFLKKHQLISHHSSIYGGLKGSHPVWGPYLRFRYPNWSVKFFVDALLQ